MKGEEIINRKDKINRRNFLKGILAVTAIAISPIPDLHAYPILYGDGIHDDTKALQALLDLNPYVCEELLIQGQNKAIIKGGTFKITSGLVINNDNTSISYTSFHCHIKDGDAALTISYNSDECNIFHNTIITPPSGLINNGRQA